MRSHRGGITIEGMERLRAPILFTHWGEEGIRGSERVLLDLLARIDRDRFPPFLWCNAKTLASAANDLGIRTRHSRMPILLGWDNPRYDLRGYRALVMEAAKLIGETGARLVHANSGAPNQWMVPAARRARIPLVAHLHAIYGLRERCTLLLHQVPMIVGCSQAALRPFRSDGFPESRLRVIYNGVDSERLSSGDARGLRNSLGIPDSDLLVVAVGALVHLKGFDTVLGSLHGLRERGVDAHLAIVGEGPERASLAAMAVSLKIDNRVHFLGERPDVGAIFRDAADVVAIGSRVESFGLVAAEAGVAARPTVATDVGGVAEVVEDGVTGLLVPPEDFSTFADALTRLARDPALRQSLGTAARERVLARFTAEEAARSFESLYSELVSRRAETFGWWRLGFRVAPFVRLGVAVARRRIGQSVRNP